jgi:hypothetical protein
MSLTNLGETYIERFDVPQEYIDQRDPERGADLVTELDVSASVRHAITGPEGSQTVFVYVTNQWQKPVSGAEVTTTVRYEPGEEYNFACLPTDLSSFSERDFDIRSGLVLPSHKVVIEVVATYGGLTGTTQTSFLPWW